MTEIIDCKLLNDVPGNLHIMFRDDADGRWLKEAEKIKQLDMSKVYRLNGTIWVKVKENVS